jgi:hypothetical protein
MLVDYLLPLVFIMLLVLVMLMLVFIMLISPFLWLVIPLPLPCLTSWNFIRIKMLFVAYSFNKKKYISCIFIICPNLLIFVHFDFIYFMYWRSCVNNMLRLVYARKACNLQGNFELLHCIVKEHFEVVLHFHISINLMLYVDIMSFMKSGWYLWIICRCVCFFSHSARLKTM